MTTAARTGDRLITAEELASFVARAFRACGVGSADAAIAADVLVTADLRGVNSHGVGRLRSHYIDRLLAGVLAPVATAVTVRETPTTIVIDAGNGLGHPAATRAMNAVLEKAATAGVAFGTVKNTNHFGIAAYYAMQALDRDMIGIASTSAVRCAAPTFGTEVLLGTNPWAYAVPAGREPPFVLDFATTAVPRGRIEVYDRRRQALGRGWAIDAQGNETLDAATALRGALVPLGGSGTENGGHKGYGLSVLVDIMCAVLSGGSFGRDIPGASDAPQPGKISQFFGAIRIDAFRDVAAFKADMDRELRAFKDSQRAPGFDRLYVAGEIEAEVTERRRRDGIPLDAAVWKMLEGTARELNIPLDVAS